MSETPARVLESTLRRCMAQAGVFPRLKLRDENQAADPDAARLPELVITCQETGDNLTIKQGGRYATDFDAALTCRVAGNLEGSPELLEAFAKEVRSAMGRLATLCTAAGIADWTFLAPYSQGDERGRDGDTRELTLRYNCTGLTAAP